LPESVYSREADPASFFKWMDTANAIGWRVPFTSFTWKLAASVFVAVAALQDCRDNPAACLLENLGDTFR
jgi:hypothetical protein